MKTLYYNRTGYILLNDDNSIGQLNSEMQRIDRIFIAEEDMHIVYKRGERDYETDAKKGDLVVVFYETEFEKPVVAVQSADWYNNLVKYNAEEQKRKEEWAKEKSEDTTPCCDACDTKCPAC